jgi:hypothetical protein
MLDNPAEAGKLPSIDTFDIIFFISKFCINVYDFTDYFPFILQVDVSAFTNVGENRLYWRV